MRVVTKAEALVCSNLQKKRCRDLYSIQETVGKHSRKAIALALHVINEAIMSVAQRSYWDKVQSLTSQSVFRTVWTTIHMDFFKGDAYTPQTVSR
jgi:hypothetical protein